MSISVLVKFVCVCFVVLLCATNLLGEIKLFKIYIVFTKNIFSCITHRKVTNFNENYSHYSRQNADFTCLN